MCKARTWWQGAGEAGADVVLLGGDAQEQTH